VHIGIPKTASSFLQTVLFPRFSDEGFAVSTTGDRASWPPELSWVYLTDRPIFSSKNRPWGITTRASEHIRFALTGEWNKPVSGGAGKPHQLISSEGLAGWGLNPAVNAKIHARQLAKSIPEARVLGVFRRHLDWTESMYHQLVVREKRYFQIPSLPPVPLNSVFGSTRQSVVQLQDLEFARVASAYSARFGQQNCLFLDFDDLAKEPEWFVRRILRFCEVPDPQSTEKLVKLFTEAPPANVRSQDELSKSAKWSQGERLELQRFVEADWQELNRGFLEHP